MAYRLVRSKYWLINPLVFFFLLVTIQPSRGQEAQKAPASPNGGGPQRQKDSAVPKSTKSDAVANKDGKALLTKEYAVVTNDPPKMVEKAEVPNSSFIREWYRAEWRAGDPFYFFVIRPKGVAKTPVMLYLPSFPDDTELFTNNQWCELAVRGGYTTVGFVGAVTGHRTRYRLMKEWFVSEMPEALTSTVHDVQLILNFLSTRSDLDMEHVGMYGTGSGGAIAILASVADSRIKVLDLLAPWGDWKTWLSESKVVPDGERANYLKPEFLSKVTPLDPIEWLPKILAKSVRIEDIRGNKAMPDKSQEKLEAAAPGFTLINQWGNGRAFLAAQVPPSVLEWAKSQLAADAKAPPVLAKSERIHVFPAVAAPASSNLPAPASAQPAKAPDTPKPQDKTKQNPQ
jgi:hypothetical protein